MKVQCERLSYKKDGHTLCQPSAGYSQNALIEIEHYEEVEHIEGSLPPSDDTFPKGAPVTDYVKIVNGLFKRKPP
jgi:hypothetical protein